MSDTIRHATNVPEGCKMDVIVPSHGHVELTIQCINALYKHTSTPCHIIVLDDTQDMTHEYIAQVMAPQHPNMTYIHRETPYKYGNQIFEDGFALCKTEIAGTVMNSINVEPEWEDIGLKMMEKDPEIGVIGLKCLFPTGYIESAGIAMGAFTRDGKQHMAKWLPTDIGRDQAGHRLAKIYPCEAVQWAFALVRRKAAQGFIAAENVFHGFRGWDDIDNCFVLRKHGWKILYCGLGVGYHVPRATRGDDSEKALEENRQNGEMFHKRWGLFEAFMKDNPDYKERYGPGIMPPEAPKQPESQKAMAACA